MYRFALVVSIAMLTAACTPGAATSAGAGATASGGTSGTTPVVAPPGSGGTAVAGGDYVLVVDGAAVAIEKTVTDLTRGAIPTLRGFQFGATAATFAGSGGKKPMLTVQLTALPGADFNTPTFGREVVGSASITLAGGPAFGKSASKSIASVKDVSADVFNATRTATGLTIHFNTALGEGDTLKTQFDAFIQASEL